MPIERPDWGPVASGHGGRETPGGWHGGDSAGKPAAAIEANPALTRDELALIESDDDDDAEADVDEIDRNDRASPFSAAFRNERHSRGDGCG